MLGKTYYDKIVNQWINEKDKSTFPIVWVSINPNCKDLLVKDIPLDKTNQQADNVEICNRYVNNKLLMNKFPYWDAGSVLRSSERCNKTADGVHVKMYVDIMRAKMLFNHLCDENMNWRGSIEYFI